MRGIPEKIATKQDFFNICNDLHHAQARIFLKEIAPEELKRLGVTRDDIKKIKTHLALRKRKETMENRELARLKSALEENQTRLEKTRTAFKAKSDDLKKNIAGRELIEPKTEEVKTLNAELAGIRKLPDRVLGISEILRNLNGVLLELGNIDKVIDDCDPGLVEIWGITDLVLTRIDEIAGLYDELRSARIAAEQRRSVMDKLSEIEKITQEIRELREGAETIDQTKQELQELNIEMKRLEAEEAELQSSLKEV